MEAPSSSSPASELLLHYVEIVWRFKKQLFLASLCVAIVTAGLVLLIHNRFVAETTVLPDLDMMSLASKFGGLGELASAAGLNTSITSPAQLYPDILASETLLSKVIYHRYRTETSDSLENLIQIFKFNKPDTNLNFERCLELLQKGIVSISVDKKTFITTVDVETTEPGLSADIANQMTFELDDYERNFRKSNASEQRIFLEQRLKDVKKDLAVAEDKLTDFQEKNRTVSQSAQLTLDQARLQRDVDLATRQLGDLQSQYDQVKLDEIKNTPVVQVLDSARPPAQKSSPKRTLLVLLFTFIGFFVSSLWFYKREELAAQTISNPAVRRLLTFLRLQPPTKEST